MDWNVHSYKYPDSAVHQSVCCCADRVLRGPVRDHVADGGFLLNVNYCSRQSVTFPLQSSFLSVAPHIGSNGSSPPPPGQSEGQGCSCPAALCQPSGALAGTAEPGPIRNMGLAAVFTSVSHSQDDLFYLKKTVAPVHSEYVVTFNNIH